jgi:hypothetical protein
MIEIRARHGSAQRCHLPRDAFFSGGVDALVDRSSMAALPPTMTPPGDGVRNTTEPSESKITIARHTCICLYHIYALLTVTKQEEAFYRNELRGAGADRRRGGINTGRTQC